VAELASKEVEEQPDQWAAYTNYLEAVRRLTEESKEEENGEKMESEATDLVKRQQESHPMLRGPWLAQLELLSVMGQASDSEVSPKLSMLGLNFPTR
jgi:leucyl aminopeptidase